MKYETDGHVGDALEGLVTKIERLNREKLEEYEKSRRALASMDKLNDAMARLELQKRREKIVTRKIASVYEQMERASGAERSSISTKSLSEITNKLLSGAKITGQVIETVAGSLQVMIDAVAALVKSQSGMRGTAPESKGLDLSSLLKPVNALLNSMVTRQQQAAEQAAEAKTPPEAKDLSLSKEEKIAVPVVKAVSVPDNPSLENN